MTQNAVGDDPWAEIGTRRAAYEKLHAEGELFEVPCAACGYPTLAERGHNHICVVCHWRDDGSDRQRPDQSSEANHGLTLREAASHIATGGVFVLASQVLPYHEYFAPAVREARADLVAAYERLATNPRDSAARTDVQAGRARLMRAIVSEMP